MKQDLPYKELSTWSQGLFNQCSANGHLTRVPQRSGCKGWEVGLGDT